MLEELVKQGLHHHPASWMMLNHFIIKLFPALVDVHNNLGNILQALERHNEAGQAYLRALELNSDPILPWRIAIWRQS